MGRRALGDRAGRGDIGSKEGGGNIVTLQEPDGGYLPLGSRGASSPMPEPFLKGLANPESSASSDKQKHAADVRARTARSKLVSPRPRSNGEKVGKNKGSVGVADKILHEHVDTPEEKGCEKIEELPSAMRVSIEAQQLTIHFNEMLQEGVFTEPATEKTRPLMKYFHAAVRRVIRSQKRFVAQDVVQRMVLSMVDDEEKACETERLAQQPCKVSRRTSAGRDAANRGKSHQIQEKEPTREHLLGDVEEGMAFWRSMRVAAAGGAKTRGVDRDDINQDGSRERPFREVSAMHGSALIDRVETLQSDVLRDALRPLAGKSMPLQLSRNASSRRALGDKTSLSAHAPGAKPSQSALLSARLARQRITNSAHVFESDSDSSNMQLVSVNDLWPPGAGLLDGLEAQASRDFSSAPSWSSDPPMKYFAALSEELPRTNNHSGSADSCGLKSRALNTDQKCGHEWFLPIEKPVIPEALGPVNPIPIPPPRARSRSSRPGNRNRAASSETTEGGSSYGASEYLRVCESKGLMPHLPHFRDDCSRSVDLAGCRLGDNRLAAVLPLAGTDFQEMDLSGNQASNEAINQMLLLLGVQHTPAEKQVGLLASQITKSFGQTFKKLGLRQAAFQAKKDAMRAIKDARRAKKESRGHMDSARRPLSPSGSTLLVRKLSLLDLSGTQLSHEAVVAVSSALRLCTLMITVLRLNEVPIPTEAFGPLADAILTNRKVQELSISDTQCGRASQESCRCVASLVMVLESLDVSHNFFRADGLRELAHMVVAPKCVLEFLNLSGNVWVMGDRAGAVSGRNSSENATSQRHEQQLQPMLELCEAFGRNRSLTSLDLSNCQLSRFAATCLEDAFVNGCCKMRQIDISENPLGEAGFRSIMRLGVFPNSSFKKIRVSATRSEFTAEPSVTYNPGDFVEDYRGPKALDLTRPYHRAILRLLLRRAKDLHVKLEEGLRGFTLDGKPASPAFGPGGIPNCGVVEFDLMLDVIDSSIDSASEAMKWWQYRRKIKVEFQRFPTIMRIWQQLRTDDERHLFIKASAKDCIFKLTQVKFFAREIANHSPHLVPQTISLFSQSLENADRQAINAVLQSYPSRDPKSHFLRVYDKVEMLLVNVDNMSGRHRMDLADPAGFALCERLIIVDLWEARVAVTRGLLDCSEAGGHHGIRNFFFDSKRLFFSADWQLPGDGFSGDGLFHCDYATPLMDTKAGVRVRGRKPPEVLPDLTFSSIISLIRREGTDVSVASRIMALKNIAHRFFVSTSQLHALLRALPQSHAIDMFVCFFSRCLGFGSPLLDIHTGVIADPDLFSATDKRELHDRLGMMNIYDYMNLHCEDHFLRQLGFDLAYQDQRKMANLVIKLAVIEPGENMVNQSWTEWTKRGNRAEASSCGWTTPATWVNDIPTVGVWKVEYVCQPGCYRKAARERVCREELAWARCP